MLAKKLRRCQHQFAKCDPAVSSNNVFYRLFESRLNNFIPATFVDSFWDHLPENFDARNPNSHKPFIEAIGFLSNQLREVTAFFADHNNETLRGRLFLNIQNQILAHKPHQLTKYLQATYFRGFRVFLNIERMQSKDDKMQVDNVQDEDEDDIEDNYEDIDGVVHSRFGHEICHGCSGSKCNCSSIYAKFCKMNENLRNLGLLEGLVGPTIMDTSKIFIKRHVSARGKSNYSRSYLKESTSWVRNVMKPWVATCYGFTDQADLDDLGHKLDQYLRDAYANVRVSHMFDIIVEYPNSEAAIQDMKLCLDGSTPSTFWLDLIDSVKVSLTENLLHPGVATYDILTAYIAAIKALRALDPSGLILQLVTEPVRRYLKSRDDTVRCIVTALTDGDHNSELNKEMMNGSSQTNENGVFEKSGTSKLAIPSEDEVFTEETYEQWKVDPIQLKPTDDGMKAGRFSDIVSILVNIYETKDLFVEEYQKLLSQRLLSKYDGCSLETEFKNLELLTLRFSDCELHRCEVMLKDVQTSKRINKRILSDEIRGNRLENFRNLDVLIVSSPFWPEKFGPMATVSDEAPTIQFPAEIEEAIHTYKKAFEAIQASRTLHWRHHLGLINMDLTINGKTQNFTVSPLHAALIYLFKEKKSWRLSEIIHLTSLPGATIRSRLLLWKNNGLIRESGEDKYDLVED